jgi:hypothetical protein
VLAVPNLLEIMMSPRQEVDEGEPEVVSDMARGGAAAPSKPVNDDVVRLSINDCVEVFLDVSARKLDPHWLALCRVSERVYLLLKIFGAIYV